MWRRSVVSRCLRVSLLVISCSSVGVEILFSDSLLGMAAGAAIPGSSNVFQIFQVLIWLLVTLAVIRSGVTGSKSACAFNIKNRILQIVDKATSHKSFNESCRGEVFERINDVDEFVGFVLSLFCNLVGGLLVVLFSAVLLGFYYLGAGVVLPLAVLTLIVFLVKALSRWCKKSLCSFDPFNTNLDLSKDIEDSFNHCEKERKSEQDIGRIIIRYIKIILQLGRRIIVELDDIVCKFLPILTTVLLVVQEDFPSELLVVGTVFCCSLANGICKMGDIFFALPETKKRIQAFRKGIKMVGSTTGDNESDSMSDWRCVYQLFTGTGRFGNLKE